jgi:hypothetical protein
MSFFFRSVFAWIILAITVSSVDARPYERPYECSDFGYSGIERPRKPNCFEFPFETRTVFEMCQMDMDSYTSKMRRYLACLKAEADEAIKEHNSAVESFNCSARGSFC